MADEETRPRSRPSSLAALEARLNGTPSVPRWDRVAGKGYCSGKGFGHHRDSGGKGGGGKGGSGKGGGKGGQGGRGRSCVCVLDVLPPGTSLLGDACSFCDSFFHVRDTREAGLPLCCLRHHAECEGRNTVIVARLTDREGRVLFVARFMNRDKRRMQSG